MHSPSLSGVSANKRAHASSPSVTSDMSVISASYDERPHKHQREQRCGARRLRLATISATTAQPCSHQPKQNHRSELASVACASSVRKARTNHAARNSRSFVKTTDQLAHLRINAPLLRVLNHFFDAQTDSTRSANFNPQLHNVNFRITRPRTRHAHHQFTNRSSKRCDQIEVQHTPALQGLLNRTSQHMQCKSTQMTGKVRATCRNQTLYIISRGCARPLGPQTLVQLRNKMPVSPTFLNVKIGLCGTGENFSIVTRRKIVHFATVLSSSLGRTRSLGPQRIVQQPNQPIPSSSSSFSRLHRRRFLRRCFLHRPSTSCTCLWFVRA